MNHSKEKNIAHFQKDQVGSVVRHWGDDARGEGKFEEDNRG
jgi:hypothetical protein